MCRSDFEPARRNPQPTLCCEVCCCFAVDRASLSPWHSARIGRRGAEAPGTPMPLPVSCTLSTTRLQQLHRVVPTANPRAPVNRPVPAWGGLICSYYRCLSANAITNACLEQRTDDRMECCDEPAALKHSRPAWLFSPNAADWKYRRHDRSLTRTHLPSLPRPLCAFCLTSPQQRPVGRSEQCRSERRGRHSFSARNVALAAE